jgi:opacity protein-like surface antigen
MTGNTRRASARIAMAFVCAVCAASFAAAQDVSYNAMPGTDFSKFKTYKWVVITGAQHPDQIVDAQIKDAFDTQLATKKLTKVTADTADLYVGYQVAITQQRQWSGFGGGFRFGGMGQVSSSNIDTGTLVFDVYDQAGKQLIWSGTASNTIDSNPNPKSREKNIDKAVEKMLKNFMQPAKK